MKPSENCIEFIKSFEGLYLNAYDDGGGVWTIGWGTIKYPNGIKVHEGDKCTESEAQEYLEFEVNKKANAVTNLIKEIPINQNQYDSLVSFAYNVGINALAESTLLRKFKVNPHDNTIYQYALDEHNKPVIDSCEFLKWVRDNGKIIAGLVNRRKAEADLYKS